MLFEYAMLFTATVFLASIIPGPSMLLALTHGLRHGPLATVFTALGNVCASLLQAAASMAGLGALLTASETAFLAVKWMGAAYLVYLGFRVWRSSEPLLNVKQGQEPPVGMEHKEMFLQGFLVAMGNPKAVVFFTALFPQFIDPVHAWSWQWAAFLLIDLSVIAFLCFMLYALGGRGLVVVFQRASLARCLNRLVGGAFIASGVGLALERSDP